MTATADMRQTALNRANEIRIGRANMRRDIRALPSAQGRAAIAALLRDPPEIIEALPVGQLLEWPCRSGPAMVHRWCQRAMVNQMFRIAGSYEASSRRGACGALTASQRERLAALLLRSGR